MIIGKRMHEAQTPHQLTGNAARIFSEFTYQTYKSWSCSRRMVAKAEDLDMGRPPLHRHSLTAEQWTAQQLYEKLYCGRGEIENHFKEQMCLFAHRLSTEDHS